MEGWPPQRHRLRSKVLTLSEKWCLTLINVPVSLLPAYWHPYSNEASTWCYKSSKRTLALNTVLLPPYALLSSSVSLAAGHYSLTAKHRRDSRNSSSRVGSDIGLDYHQLPTRYALRCFRTYAHFDNQPASTRRPVSKYRVRSSSS